jgi:xanthine dehydrogenase accessory factor
MERTWSVSASEVHEAAARALSEGRDAVLATVVAVDGNSYRRPGAKMLVTPDGGVGAITAGCLEDEVERLAAEVVEAGAPRVETYDLMEDEDDVWGLGVGCNGIIDVLLEPLDESYRPAIDAVAAGEELAVVTVVSGDAVGARGFVDPDAGLRPAPSGDGLGDDLASAVDGAARELLERDASETVTLDAGGTSVDVFVDAITPPPDLLVLGSGHDVGPVVELAARNGFRTTVVGFRGAVDLDDLFPDADRTLSTSPARLRETVDVDGNTYAVVMTHNFVDDRLSLEELLDTPTPYVGLLGPRERFEEMREAFAEEGRTFSEAELEAIYTPVGLDLGDGTPYGIATSIVAEVITVHNGRTPRHLSAREGPIHDRPDLEGIEAEGPSADRPHQ